MASTARIEELRKKYEENQRRYFAPLANEYRKAGQLEEAIALCRAWLPQQPGHMSGHIVFGQTLFEAGELSEARTVFETALELDPENLIALRHLGDIARQYGEVDAARSWYRRVLDADPRNDEIAALLSQLDSFPGTSTSTVAGSEESTPSDVASIRFEADVATGSLSAGAEVAGASLSGDVDLARGSIGGEASVGGGSFSAEADAATGAISAAADVTGASLSAEAAAWSGTVELREDGPALGDRTVDEARSPGQDAPFAGVSGGRTPDAADTLFDDSPPDGTSASDQLAFEASLGLSNEGLQASADVQATHAGDAGGTIEAQPASSGTGDTLAPEYASVPGIHNEVADERPAAIDAANELGLEVMEFVPPPRNASSARTEEPNPFDGHLLTDDTGTSGDTPAAFVTETMAELYLQQGFRDEALGVYRQLLQQNPGDDALRERVNQLESGSRSSVGMAAISDEVIESARLRQTAHTPPSMRAFLGRLAGRRAPRREADAGTAKAGNAAEARSASDVETAAEAPAAFESEGASGGPTALDSEGASAAPPAFGSERASEPPAAFSSNFASEAVDSNRAAPGASHEENPGAALDFDADPRASDDDWAAESDERLPAGADSARGNFPNLDEFAGGAAFGSTERGSVEAEAEAPAPERDAGAAEPAAPSLTWEGTGDDDSAAAQEVPAPGSSARAAADNGAESAPAPKASEGVSGLFPDAVIQAGDDAAASALAAAFAPPEDRQSGKLLGRPTRAANNEISLDHVFRESGPRPSTPKERTNFSFDQFFSEGASGGAGGGETGKAPEEDSSTDDIEQFNSWLEGLKKK